MCDDYTASIEALAELSGWLGGSPRNQQKVDEIIAQLRAPETLTDRKKQQLRHMLSGEMLFHPKWLGDCDVKDFPSDGTHFSWWNYLARVRDICQKDLA